MSRMLMLILVGFAVSFSALHEPPAQPNHQLVGGHDAAFFHSATHVESQTAQALGMHQTGVGIHSLACCKVCSASIACGNTCISRNDICHVGPGCACNG